MRTASGSARYSTSIEGMAAVLEETPWGSTDAGIAGEAAPIRAVAEWAEGYRRFWDASFARLDEYLEQMKQKEGDHGRGE